MNTTDYQRASLTFRIDRAKKEAITASRPAPFTLNNARIPLDSRCQITDKESGESQNFALGVSCKTEIVGAERDIWTFPNADFKPIVSDTHVLTVKTYERAGMSVPLYPPSLGDQPERQLNTLEDAFDTLSLDVPQVDGELLEDSAVVVEQVLANRLLNAITTIETERYTAAIEYPVKTINANERDSVYQPDTGPVLFPDLSVEPQDLIAGMQLAYVAFNTSSWAEFIVRVPTPLTDEISVYHYSKSVRLDAHNQIIAL
tara:strand:- start:152 stop:928 length:777 start_codon:yes stop_codon:yes gene_type:complete